MSILSPFLSIDSPCDQTLPQIRSTLSQVGLSAVQTFNLNTARLGVHHVCCPNHGAEVCDCQMIVLLVYGEAAGPATLILHGNDGKTWVSIAADILQGGDEKLVASIRHALADLISAEV